MENDKLIHEIHVTYLCHGASKWVNARYLRVVNEETFNDWKLQVSDGMPVGIIHDSKKYHDTLKRHAAICEVTRICKEVGRVEI